MRGRERRLRGLLARAVAVAVAGSAAGAIAGASSCIGGAQDGTNACVSESLDAAAYDPDGAAAGCDEFKRLPCGMPATATMRGCFPDLQTCAQLCTLHGLYYCVLWPTSCDDEAGVLPDADVILECTGCPGNGGRRPIGLAAARAIGTSALGAYFASIAHLESASVRAFRDLEAWLAYHRAPHTLARAAHRAAADERLHARSMARVARRFGGTPPRPRVARRRSTPSLAELLEDGAVEGCVGETHGALIAAFQAENAVDPRIRRAMRRIADDEAAHAALAWDVLAWGVKRLGARDRARVKRALARGLASIAPLALDAEVRRTAGLPSVSAETRLRAATARIVRDESRRAMG